MKTMREHEGGPTGWLRRELVAPWKEIVVVLAIVIGYSSFSSAWQAWHGSSLKYMNLLLTDGRMLHSLAIESAFLALLFLFLSWRGWTTADLRIRPGGWSTLLGGGLMIAMLMGNSVTVVALFILSFAAQHGTETFLGFVTDHAPHLQPNSIAVSWAVLVPGLILNAYFEEITTMAYAFNQLAMKWGPGRALGVVVLFRMSCHTYQGPIHALGIGVAFTVSGLVYLRTKNLWPLIFAHILLDLLSMGFIKILFGRA